MIGAVNGRNVSVTSPPPMGEITPRDILRQSLKRGRRMPDTIIEKMTATDSDIIEQAKIDMDAYRIRQKGVEPKKNSPKKEAKPDAGETKNKAIKRPLPLHLSAKYVGLPLYMATPVRVSIGPEKKTITSDSIMLAVSKAAGTRIAHIKGESRFKENVAPRHVFCYLVHKHRPHFSLSMIGRILNRDHSTILHAIRSCQKGHHRDLAERAESLLREEGLI